MRIPPLKAIVAFESVARTKSVNRAADELGLTPSAVSHQLANLETIVGRPLFARLGRGLVLTATGQQYLIDVTGSLADLSRATERASSESSVEILRIHSSPSFGLMWLLPRLALFHEANGNIQLNLDCSYEDVSFTSGYYDLDIRHGYAHWSDGEVLTLRDECVTPLASPEYLRRNPVQSPADLLERRLILSQTPLVQWKQWFGKFGVPLSRKAFDFSFDRSYMSIEAAALGHGIALESTMLAAGYLSKGTLVPVFGRDFEVAVGAHHIVYPAQNAILLRVSAFLAWTQHEISRDTAGRTSGMK
ncbi:LysR substrate-binding domain-containing protein [Caballeronia sp. DA-9]|uniref:LysR substrate-binding domain-containing protein n=1 Tax=Caballeronia sp. DA-9 TaxID=3436237 RepID=UPI003F665645